MSISAEFVVSLSYAWMISFKKEVAIMAIHLNFDNRLDIEKYLKNNYSLSEIARELNRHKSTISREIIL